MKHLFILNNATSSPVRSSNIASGKRKDILLLLVAYLLSFSFSSCGQDDKNGSIPPPPDEGSTQEWELVFEENFDGTEVNRSEWSMYNGSGHVGNGLRRPEAFSVADGLLVVTAGMKDGQLVSGGMAHRRNYKYGRFEFRVRTEADPGSATSGVVLTWPQNENWPVDGELDIYETLTNPVREPFHTYIHYGADNSQFHFEHKADAKEWHTMMLEWLPETIHIYRDGQKVYTLDNTVGIPQVPHHLCIQLDAFKKEMTGVVKMYVDWVKVYQFTEN
jgi:beta-glucanase (GH16 family)